MVESECATKTQLTYFEAPVASLVNLRTKMQICPSLDYRLVFTLLATDLRNLWVDKSVMLTLFLEKVFYASTFNKGSEFETNFVESN